MQMQLDALNFATEKHRGQMRARTGAPFISHPIAVSYLVASYKPHSHRLEELLAAALLHDTLEYTDTTFIEIAERFNPFIASLVLELTDVPAEINRIEAYDKIGQKTDYLSYKMRSMSRYALLIKLAACLHHLSEEAPTPKRIQGIINLMSMVRRGGDRLPPSLERLTNAVEAACKTAESDYRKRKNSKRKQEIKRDGLMLGGTQKSA